MSMTSTPQETVLVLIDDPGSTPLSQVLEGAGKSQDEVHC